MSRPKHYCHVVCLCGSTRFRDEFTEANRRETMAGRIVMDIKIEYDGAYPNLCSGTLVVTVDGKRWEFPPYCLSSGGSVWFDDEWSEHVESGPWSVSNWPDGFPEEQKQAVEDAVNAEIPEGCCGGCA